MEYEDIRSAFLSPTAIPATAPLVPDTPARRLRDAVEPIATIGWWGRPAWDNAAALGLDFIGYYMWGRAASLGDSVDPAVVASAFGAFEPDMVTIALRTARSAVSRNEILDRRCQGATDALAATTADIPSTEIDTVARALLEALGALDGMGRPLFSGLRALPIPEDPYGRVWRAAELVREHRGDGHLGACVTVGLDTVEMSVLTEVWLGFVVGEYAATRGFTSEKISAAAERLTARGWLRDGLLTEEGRAQREAVESATDASQAALVSLLGGAIDEVIRTVARISDTVVTAHVAPADPRKRAAG